MATIFIDDQETMVADGSTILAAAETIGVRIPTLCHVNGCTAQTSCFVCVVKLHGASGAPDRVVPACATLVTDGMQIESESDAVHALRRTALELLISEHDGDCVAPCELFCPARLNIPTMLRALAAGDMTTATDIIYRRVPLPATLGRICPAPCEKGCRRAKADGAVPICALKRLVGDSVTARTPTPCTPNPAQTDPTSGIPSTTPADIGRQVAVIGTGPCGLSATWFLRRAGCAVTVYEAADRPGGRLLDEPGDRLPPAVLREEIATILYGDAGLSGECTTGGGGKNTLIRPAVLRCGERVDAAGFARLRREYDAVLVAVGERGAESIVEWGLICGGTGIPVDRTEWVVPGDSAGLFAAGGATRRRPTAVRSVGDGREAAEAIERFLSAKTKSAKTTESAALEHSLYTTRRRLDSAEIVRIATVVDRDDGANNDPESALVAAGFGEPALAELLDAAREARRCLRCDCVARNDCRLRRAAAKYGAEPARFADSGSENRDGNASDDNGDTDRLLPQRFAIPDPDSGEMRMYSFEPAKCIRCGICVVISSSAAEPGRPGVAFTGRGSMVQVLPPFDTPLDHAFAGCADRCAEHCPTAAIARVGE